MSRHRNFRNLTEDDMYDHYDDDYYDEEYDDYDDNYTAEENEAYYREQERLKEEEEAKKKKKQQQKQQQQKQQQQKKKAQSKGSTQKTGVSTSISINTKIIKPPGSLKKSNNNNNNQDAEKERLVTSMGFSTDQAKLALERNSWNVEMAINDLLSANIQEGSRDNKKLPKPKTDSKKNNLIVKGGVMAPPPGWGKPDSSNSDTSAKKNNSVVKGGVMAPPPGWDKPNDSSNGIRPKKKETKSIPIKYDKKNPLQLVTVKETDTKPKKKISDELIEQIKGQKSRLSMVILGHVDAGKSTLMGQVLVQVGVVQKRVITKYQKQGMVFNILSFFEPESDI